MHYLNFSFKINKPISLKNCEYNVQQWTQEGGQAPLFLHTASVRTQIKEIFFIVLSASKEKGNWTFYYATEILWYCADRACS